jgi:hypothetical protein
VFIKWNLAYHSYVDIGLLGSSASGLVLFHYSSMIQDISSRLWKQNLRLAQYAGYHSSRLWKQNLRLAQ